jgi:hypothetical protein
VSPRCAKNETCATTQSLFRVKNLRAPNSLYIFRGSGHISGSRFN